MRNLRNNFDSNNSSNPVHRSADKLSHQSQSATSSPAWEADWTDFHRGRHHQWCFRRITHRKFVMHETTFYDRLILQYNLVAVTTLQTFLIPIALMSTVLHLLEVPYHTELAHCCNNMTFLLAIFSYLNRTGDISMGVQKNWGPSKHQITNTKLPTDTVLSLISFPSLI